MVWALRLSWLLHRTPSEVLATVTGPDLALYQAWVEHDGPWWGEREADLLRTLCSLAAARCGVHIPPDDFRAEWTIGDAGDDRAGANLLPPADGLEIFAGLVGAELTRV